jgi:hypothetical protein
MGVFRYRQSDRQFLLRLYEDGQTVTDGSVGYNYVPYDGPTRLYIGSEGHTTGPDYSQANYRGRIYFVAWYKGTFMAGADMDALWDGTKDPWDIANLYCYLDMSAAVASTYTPEYQLGPNAPYVFNVYGTPILNG